MLLNMKEEEPCSHQREHPVVAQGPNTANHRWASSFHRGSWKAYGGHRGCRRSIGCVGRNVLTALMGACQRFLLPKEKNGKVMIDHMAMDFRKINGACRAGQQRTDHGGRPVGHSRCNPENVYRSHSYECANTFAALLHTSFLSYHFLQLALLVLLVSANTLALCHFQDSPLTPFPCGHFFTSDSSFCLSLSQSSCVMTQQLLTFLTFYDNRVH